MRAGGESRDRATGAQDEAGPYQAIPQPGASWQPEGYPAVQPHEYERGGTAKLLTLFRPATGILRAKGVVSAPNAVLHPWLQEQLSQVLAGHLSCDLVLWFFEHGIMPLYTPIGGSWLNMAESVQRIIVPRALSGQHPTDSQQIIDWLEQTVAGWNKKPTPFVWNGKRRRRRERARIRRLGGSGAALVKGYSIDK